MPKILYESHRISPARRATIDRVNTIVREYGAKGFSLTLRQLYYQFVSRGWIENSKREYNRLGETVSIGRMVGLIDWSAIADRLRELHQRSHWQHPRDIIRDASEAYHIDLWEDQPEYVEVWVEKDALSDVVRKACHEFDVPYLVCRGFNSQTALWEAGQRIAQRDDWGQHVTILHLGDHDPSGVDMTRDNRDRVSMFAQRPVEVERIALTMDQVDEYQPPPNPAKETDSRARRYIEQYGPESWELDALDPVTLTRIIQNHIRAHLDQEQFDAKVRERTEARALLKRVADKWDTVATAVSKRGRKGKP